MDNFFADFDPALSETLKKEIPSDKLSSMIQAYNGSDTKEGHIQAIIAMLESMLANAGNPTKAPIGDQKQEIGLLALCHTALDDWNAAAADWQRIVDVDDRKTPEDHPDRDLAAMFNLGIMLNRADRYAEAENIMSRLLPMLEAVPALGKTSQQYAGTLSSLMLAVGKQGRLEEARRLYSDHDIVIQNFDEDSLRAHSEVAKKILSDIEHDAREG